MNAQTAAVLWLHVLIFSMDLNGFLYQSVKEYVVKSVAEMFAVKKVSEALNLSNLGSMKKGEGCSNWGDLSSADHSEDDSNSFETPTTPTRRGKKIREIPEPLPLMEGQGKSLKVLGFSQNQRADFLQILIRYGKLLLSHIAEDITDSPTFTEEAKKAEVICYGEIGILSAACASELVEEDWPVSVSRWNPLSSSEVITPEPKIATSMSEQLFIGRSSKETNLSFELYKDQF